MEVIYAILVVVVLGAFYGVVYYLNHKIPVPSGCEDISESCKNCSISSCGLRHKGE